MIKKKINLIKNYYDEKLFLHKKGYKAVNWSNKKSQFLRFKKVCEIGNLHNKKILDVGSGLSHFYDYLSLKNIECKYIGIDISENMIASSKKRINKSNAKFYCHNILNLNDKLVKKFKSDYVINSGLFTVKHKISSKEWWKLIQKMIQNMYKLSNLGICFNLMKTNVDFKENHLHYQSIDELLKFLHKKVSNKVIIKSDYPLWEYTCYVYK